MIGISIEATCVLAKEVQGSLDLATAILIRDKCKESDKFRALYDRDPPGELEWRMTWGQRLPRPVAGTAPENGAIAETGFWRGCWNGPGFGSTLRRGGHRE